MNCCRQRSQLNATQTAWQSLQLHWALTDGWYDTITTEGHLRWQNKLNQKNKPFFDRFDGIFVNYTWMKKYPKDSAAIAGDRKFDVYMGVDVFGRGTFGGGNWAVNGTLDVLKKADVSAAIFAPGWVHETNQPPDFETSQNHWWSLVQKSWGVVQTYPKELPFYSNFDQGRSYHFSVYGKQIYSSSWNNLSNQSFQPCLEYGEPDSSFKVVVNLKEASYSGGGNITFKGTVEGSFPHFTSRLFMGELQFGDSPVHFTYSVKSEVNSQLVLFLEFSSLIVNKETVLLAPQSGDIETMTELSRKANKVIVPHRVSNPKNAPEWVVLESVIAMKGLTLTGIHSLCYTSPKQDQATSKFYAVLGHISIRTPDHTPSFPLSSCWHLQGKNIKWNSGAEGAGKSLSVEITWKLKESHVYSSPSHYNIYLEKMGKNISEPTKFLGTAHIRSFYVSNLAVSDWVLGLRFVVQICRDEFGACQELGDSPSFLLNV